MTAAVYAARQSSSREGVTQRVSYGGTSTPSASFGPSTFQVRLSCTQGCYYLVGDGTPVVTTTTGSFLPNTWTEYVGCNPGQKIAAIQSGASAGVLTVTEIT
jgi:hypothetical protein